MPRPIPTTEQAQASVRVCQMLSTGYRLIYLFRYDDSRDIIYIIAGTENSSEQIEVRVYSNGVWRFENDETEF